MPHNNNPVFKNFSGAILMLFPKGEVEDNEKAEIQFFIVDEKFNIIENNRKYPTNANNTYHSPISIKYF